MYEKHDSACNRLFDDVRGCPDADDCYYTLDALVDCGTGFADADSALRDTRLAALGNESRLVVEGRRIPLGIGMEAGDRAARVERGQRVESRFRAAARFVTDGSDARCS